MLTGVMEKRAPRLGRLFLLGLLGLALLSAIQRVIFWSVLPYLEGTSLATFREDNFWAYSSGFMRRGLPGEFIYRLDQWTHQGPLIYSVLIAAIYFLAWVVVAREAARFFTPVQAMLALLTPLALHNGIDGEVFILLPLLYLGLRGEQASDLTALVLIALALAMRESAILFFLPLILGIMIRAGWLERLCGVAILAMFALSIVAGNDPTYLLERDYWPGAGIDDLMTRHLYLFAELPLGMLLHVHFSVIHDHLALVTPSLVLFAVLYVTVIYRRSGSVLLTAYFSAALSVFFLLTIDYGRYFYLPFAIALLITAPGVRERIWDPLSARSAARRERLASRQAPEWLAAILLGFALAPSGYYVEVYTLFPRFVVTAHELFGSVASHLRALPF